MRAKSRCKTFWMLLTRHCGHSLNTQTYATQKNPENTNSLHSCCSGHGYGLVEDNEPLYIYLLTAHLHINSRYACIVTPSRLGLFHNM